MDLGWGVLKWGFVGIFEGPVKSYQTPYDEPERRRDKDFGILDIY